MQNTLIKRVMADYTFWFLPFVEVRISVNAACASVVDRVVAKVMLKPQAVGLVVIFRQLELLDELFLGVGQLLFPFVVVEWETG